LPIKNLFFDMGNTLTHRAIDRQIGHAMQLRELGYKVTDEEMLKAYGKARLAVPRRGPYKQSIEQIDRHFMQRLEVTLEYLDLRPAEEIAETLVHSGRNPIVLFPDVIPTLKVAKERGYRLGIISNWDPGLAFLCGELGIADFFDTIIASRAVGFRKPNPEIFMVALASIEASARESVHVGDSPGSDAFGAMGVGIHPVVIDRSDSGGKLFCPILRCLEEVVPLAESL
jgi:putative hydrolase of the HAD superfamily